jgi:uncharacterized protein YeaO (DUF488 family)
MSSQIHVQIRRIYDPPLASDGKRVLVDRLWPRGVSKERAHLVEWCKEIAPSTALRQWYGHDPARYSEFARRYRVELGEPDHASLVAHLRELARDGTVTLLTAAKAVQISEAQVLVDLLTGASGPDLSASSGQ